MLFQNSKSLSQSIRKDLLLLIILFFGLFLRGLNSTFGSPSLFVSNDEAIAHLSAFNMLAEKTPVSISNYTPLGSYIQIPILIAVFLTMRILGQVSGIRDFEFFVLTHEGYFLFIPRLISAFFGTLTILVIYKITLQLFKSRRTALISAFLCATSFNLVHISHFGRPWASALFFFILGIYFLIRSKTTFSYVSIGLSYGFHQVGLFAVPLALWLTKKTSVPKNLVNMIVLFFMVLIFSFLTLKTGLVESIREDQSFLKVGKLAADILVGNQNLMESAIRSVKDNLFLFFSVNFLVTDAVIFIFAIIGMLKSFKNPIQNKLVYFIAGYFLFALLFFHPLPRYLLPIFLISIPFAANAIKKIFLENNYLIVAVLLISSINSVWWNYLYLKTPTFIEAHDFVDQNISSNEPIAYTGGRYQTFTPNKQAINLMQNSNPRAYNKLSSISREGDYGNMRNVTYTFNFEGNTKFEQFKNASNKYPILYVVDYYLDQSERLVNEAPDHFIIIAQFSPVKSKTTARVPEPLFDASWNFPFNDKKDKVSMYSLERTGPYFDILRVVN